MSIEAAVNLECSENVNVAYAQALSAYLSAGARAMQRNPVDVTPWVILLKGGAGPGRAKEGEDDARTFLKKYPCSTREAATLRSDLRKLVFARKEVPVEPENDAKMIAMINPAHRAKLGIELRPVIETPTEVIALSA